MQDRPLRIALVTETWGKDNGVAALVKDFAYGFARRGHFVTVVAPSPSLLKDEGENGFKMITVPGFPLGRTGYSIARPNQNPAPYLYNAHIIHTHHPFVLGRWSLGFHRPVVLTAHTNYLEYLRHYVPIIGSLFSCPLQRYLRWYCNRCTSVIAPASDAGRRLTSYGVRRSPEVIPNGIDTHLFGSGKGEDWRKHLGIDESEPVLVYVGRLTHEKRVDFLLRAVAQSRHAPHILIAGGGSQQPALKQLCSELDLTRHVHFVGRIEREHLPSFYDAGNVFVTASDSEVHPLTVLEAHAAGLPAVVVDAPGTREIVRHEQTGFVTENSVEAFCNGIDQLLDQPALIEVFGEAAQDHVQQYSIDTTVDRYIDLYRSIL